MKTYQVKVTFTEPLLGTVSMNPALYEEYIATKAPTVENGEQELETVEEMTEKGTTGFHRVDGKPIMYDYAIKGFCKDACGMLRRVEGTESKKLTNFKKQIDGLVFVKPRQIPIQVVGEISILTRPLRAQTAQGERVALSRSESIGPGSSMEFAVKVLGGISEKLLREWLEYGELRGLGQWRNGGYGSFTYEMVEVA